MKVLLDKCGIFIQRLEKVSVDESYKSADRNKFIGWLRKWKSARYPILLCLFIEILSPVKVLSLAFQKEDVDIVNVVNANNQTKKQLNRLMEKDFLEYPTFQRFEGKVKKIEGDYFYEDARISHFEDAKGHTQSKKDQIRDHVMHRLESTELEILTSAAIVLNSEGWERDQEDFSDEDIRRLVQHFETPLRNAGVTGVTGTIEEILDEWYDLVNYLVMYLNVDQSSYSKLWYTLFNSSRETQWSSVLLIAELLFCLPISSTVVERLFSLMKRIKTKGRCSLGKVRVSQLLRICLHVPSIEDFEPTAKKIRVLIVKSSSSSSSDSEDQEDLSIDELKLMMTDD